MNIKTRWSVSDGHSFEFYVALDTQNKKVTVATFDCGETEVLDVFSFDDFAKLNTHIAIIKMLGKDAFLEIKSTIDKIKMLL